MKASPFRTPLGEDVFHRRYAQGPNDSWFELARRLVEDVCGTRWGAFPHPYLSRDEMSQLVRYIAEMKFVPGGRYLYYAGRPAKFFNNCYALRATDTREGWGELAQKAMLCLMSGGGIGVDYSEIRPAGRVLARTGGIASGPIPLMKSLNEIGRNVMQGGARRSALWAGLNWQHEDTDEFIKIKDWSEEVQRLKAQDYNWPADLDMTNISVLWDTDLLEYDGRELRPTLWFDVVRQMVTTGEPGMCFNFEENEDETLRNACCELISEHDSDVCNLGSVNLGRIETMDELADVVDLASRFLVCGTLRAELPYEKVYKVRGDHRKIGLGLMGVHEWLLRRGYNYEPNDELEKWLQVYESISTEAADEQCDRFFISRCERYRAIAPSGTISILAGTTGGIEPLFAVAFKRRYLGAGTHWKYQYVIDPTAQYLIDELGVDPDSIETSYSLARDVEKRISMQAFIQDYVDMGISSTINLPEWGSEWNNEDTLVTISDLIWKYKTRLRGITCYPNNARKGQALTEVSYAEAARHVGVIFDASEETCKGSVCEI